MCTITIDKISGIDPNLNSIVVSGTIEGCPKPFEGPRLIVTITCQPQIIAFAENPDNLAGNTVETTDVFFGDDGKWYATFRDPGSCRCGTQITATARCFTDPECNDSLTVDPLECTRCPGIFISASDDVTLEPVAECNDDATATITVTRFVQNNTPNPVLLRVHAGHPDGEILDGESHPFNPETSGTISITFRYPTLSSPTPYIELFQFNGEPTGCAPVDIEIPTMPSCCPDIEITDIEIDDCFIVVRVDPINLPRGCTYIWDFDADNPNSEQEFGDIGQRNHTYADPGTYRVVVRVQCGSCIKSDEKLINIEKCKGKESTGCGILRTAIAISMTLILISGILALCVPAAAWALVIAAAVFAAIGAVTTWIYVFTCPDKPCNVGMLTYAQASLGTGVAAMIVSACCPWVFWAGAGLALTGFGLFTLWQSKCEQTICTVSKEVTKVIGGIVLPVFGVLVVIPILQACISNMALGIISGIFGLIATYAVSCTDD